MELILRDEDGNEVNLGVNPEEINGTCEAGAHTLYHALVDSINTLEGIQNFQNKSTVEKEQERLEREQLQGQRPGPLWHQDPGIDHPSEYS